MDDVSDRTTSSLQKAARSCSAHMKVVRVLHIIMWHFTNALGNVLSWHRCNCLIAQLKFPYHNNIHSKTLLSHTVGEETVTSTGKMITSSKKEGRERGRK